jgi:two-component system chemotaxis sensor kinase CheA
MAAELDMTQYLDLFLQEAEEQFEILEQETIKLEEDPSAERMSAIFRAAHTLKGSSRAMGFTCFAGITHEMENVLDALRAGEISLTTEIANALLQCQDMLRESRDKIAAGEGDAIENSGRLIDELKAFLTGGGTPTTNSFGELTQEIQSALEQAAEERPVYRADFTLQPDCVMKYVRAFMAINLIQEDGELLASVPDAAALEEEQFERTFSLFFHYDASEGALKQKFSGIGELETFTVMPFARSAAPTPAASEAPLKAEPEARIAPAPDRQAESVASSARKTEANQTVRVDVARLDELMNLVGELVIDRTRVAQIGAALSAKYELDDNIEALAETVGHITRITSDLQDQLMKARMLPIETVFNRFPRMVRDLAQKVGKEIKLELIGGETELDRSVIEVIGDPLLHILRNSIDHGIEPPDQREAVGKPRSGRVTVSARHQENHIVIEIVDDGRGISHEKIREKAVANGLISRDAAERLSEKEILQFIFASGLSTAEQVSEVSGRGVGMDIVKSNIQKLGGIIDLETTIGEGTRFALRLPLTLAIIQGLLVKVSGVVYVLPLGSVIETMNIDRKRIQTVNRREVVVIRGVTTPLVRLREVFTTRNFTSEPDTNSEFVVIVGLAEKRVGLVVDSLIGEQEVVIKSLNRFCGEIRGISGATILGDGNVALIVDVNGVFATE